MSLDALPAKSQARIQVCQKSGCWTWQGEIKRNGYGRVWVQGKRLMAHRVVYELLREPIGEGLFLDHLCKNRACCNPDHLEPVTPRENTLRGDAVLFGAAS